MIKLKGLPAMLSIFCASTISSYASTNTNCTTIKELTIDDSNIEELRNSIPTIGNNDFDYILGMVNSINKLLNNPHESYCCVLTLLRKFYYPKGEYSYFGKVTQSSHDRVTASLQLVTELLISELPKMISEAGVLVKLPIESVYCSWLDYCVRDSISNTTGDSIDNIPYIGNFNWPKHKIGVQFENPYAGSQFLSKEIVQQNLWRCLCYADYVLGIEQTVKKWMDVHHPNGSENITPWNKNVFSDWAAVCNAKENHRKVMTAEILKKHSDKLACDDILKINRREKAGELVNILNGELEAKKDMILFTRQYLPHYAPYSS